MKCNLYEADAAEPYARDQELSACFDAHDSETYQEALAALQAHGRYWVGGGAGELILIMRAGL